MRKISKELEKDRAASAQALAPSLATRKGLSGVRDSLETVDVDSGKSYQQKRRKMKVSMTGTSQSYSFDSKQGFKDYGSVVMTLSYASHTSIYGQMNSGNKFTLTAASAVSGLDIIVMMRGD